MPKVFPLRLSTPAEYIRKFAEACVIPIILSYSPAE